MTSLKRLAAGFALAALAVPIPAVHAQDAADKPVRPTIRVSGESTVQAKPDQAEIEIGVVTQASTGQAAAAQNAQKQDAVLAEMRKVLGPRAEIKTIGYSLSPNYRYPKEGGQPTISGYTASNVVQVKTPDLAQVGRIIDLATQSGANNVQALRFTLKDDQPVRNQALREAALQAKGKAEALASALGVKVVRILQVEEGGQTPRPMFAEARQMLLKDQAATTPVEPGMLEVQAFVSLAVEIGR